jgi:hypothetical protein
MIDRDKPHDFFPSLSEKIEFRKEILEVVERYDEVGGRFPLTGIIIVYKYHFNGFPASALLTFQHSHAKTRLSKRTRRTELMRENEVHEGGFSRV